MADRTPDPREFDRFSQDYERVLADTVRFGGEPHFFQRGKATVVARTLGADFDGTLLDYGCGVGTLLSVLAGTLPDARLHGYDPSVPSIERAHRTPGVESVTASRADLDDASYDAVVVANVLHHVPPVERPALLREILRLLRPGRPLFVFEHNPLNPLTRRVVRSCPFDEDVSLLGARALRRLLGDAGFERVHLRYTTFFPQWLALLVPLERWLGWLPAGAQTCTIGWKDGP